jgi:type IV pilus assembly protein PilC
VPRFTYLALDGDGREIRGRLDGPSADWVGERLFADELIPVEIDHDEGETDALDTIRQHLPITVEDLSLFSNQFALMLDTGLPILTALELLAENSTKPRLTRALDSAIADIRSGSSLHEALSATGRFPGIYLNMIRAAETSGTVVEVLRQLGGYLDREAELRNRLKGALIYPVFLVILAAAVVVFLMVAIIPKFTKVLVQMGVELPWPTRALIATSGFVTESWPWLLAGLAGLAVGAWVLIRDEELRLRLDGLLLAVPGIGALVGKASMSRLCFVLGSLLRGGIAIVEALDVAGATAGNRRIAASVRDARGQIVAGRGIADALAHAGTMPSLVLQMVSIGEATGNLDAVLIRVSELYDEQVARATNSMLKLVEPALIVVLGGIVGFIALSLVLPMVKAIASFGG